MPNPTVSHIQAIVSDPRGESGENVANIHFSNHSDLKNAVRQQGIAAILAVQPSAVCGRTEAFGVVGHDYDLRAEPDDVVTFDSGLVQMPCAFALIAGDESIYSKSTIESESVFNRQNPIQFDFDDEVARPRDTVAHAVEGHVSVESSEETVGSLSYSESESSGSWHSSESHGEASVHDASHSSGGQDGSIYDKYNQLAPQEAVDLSLSAAHSQWQSDVTDAVMNFAPLNFVQVLEGEDVDAGFASVIASAKDEFGHHSLIIGLDGIDVADIQLDIARFVDPEGRAISPNFADTKNAVQDPPDLAHHLQNVVHQVRAKRDELGLQGRKLPLILAQTSVADPRQFNQVVRALSEYPPLALVADVVAGVTCYGNFVEGEGVAPDGDFESLLVPLRSAARFDVPLFANEGSRKKVDVALGSEELRFNNRIVSAPELQEKLAGAFEVSSERAGKFLSQLKVADATYLGRLGEIRQGRVSLTPPTDPAHF